MAQFERSIIYPVSAPSFRDGLLDFLEDDGHRVKREFHLTVAAPAYRRALTPEQLDHFEAQLKARPLPIDYQDILYRITRPKQLPNSTYERRSIVALLRPEKIAEHIGEIAAKLGVDFPSFFPHVTIATAPDNEYARRGIGIESSEEWTALTPEVYFEGWAK